MPGCGCIAVGADPATDLAPNCPDPPAPVPEDLKQTTAYDLEATVRLLDAEWSADEIRLADTARICQVSSSTVRPGRFELMDADRWHMAHGFLMDSFALGDPAVGSARLRLGWPGVFNPAREGFDAAMEYLESTIRRYEVIAAGSS